jgi:hypothetical protein
MSYDLLVFDPEVAPKPRAEFLEWLKQKNDEPRDVNNPDVLSPKLRAWFMEMINDYPAMNGPLAPEPFPWDDDAVTDYDLGPATIYACFAWSKSDAAGQAVAKLAAKQNVGLYEVSSMTGEVWLPDGSGELVLAHSA